MTTPRPAPPPPAAAPALAWRSALYDGRVVHQRPGPVRHRLAYRMFSLLLDIDELASLHARLRWFSVGRFNLFSLWPSDHGDGSAHDAAGLRAQLDERLREAGLPVGGAIRLLALPRVLGYAFNPLSVWFCDAPDGRLQAIVYEVNNTFGERHSYLIEVPEAQRGARLIEQGCDKRLFVSPFLDMELAYRFRIEPPGERLSIGVGVHRRDGGAAVLHARLDARRRPLSDGALWRTFFAYPLLTLKVIVGIHWEALHLWRKGARLRPRPAPPAQAMSVVRSGDSSSS